MVIQVDSRYLYMFFNYKDKTNYIKIMDTLKIRFESEKYFDQILWLHSDELNSIIAD